MKKYSNAFAVFLSLAVFAGCASNPDNIDAAYVSPQKYAKYDCGQLALEMDYVGQRTTQLYQQLKDERTADNWQMGVGLILFWPSLFLLEGGDGPQAAEYSQLQGEFEALRVNEVDKQCRIAAKSPREIMQEADERAKEVATNAADNTGAKHTAEVEEIAKSSNCKEAVSLQEVSPDSETWALQCGDGKSLIVRCFDESCYVKY